MLKVYELLLVNGDPICKALPLYNVTLPALPGSIVKLTVMLTRGIEGVTVGVGVIEGVLVIAGVNDGVLVIEGVLVGVGVAVGDVDAFGVFEGVGDGDVIGSIVLITVRVAQAGFTFTTEI
jgi:hypothetical protein